MTNFQVITIAREYGSGGGAVGRRLARALGWRLLDEEITLELARRARVAPHQVSAMEERPSSFIERMLQPFGMGSMEGWAAPAPEVLNPVHLTQLCRNILLQAASLGSCVIVGRGGQCVLQDRQDAFHVFVYGARSRRIRRMQALYGSEADCETALDEIDHTRAAYIRRYYGCDWSRRQLYDLMISTDSGIDHAVAAILSAIAIPEREPAQAAIQRLPTQEKPAANQSVI